MLPVEIELEECAQNAAVVDARVHPKALVFGRDKRVDDMLWHFIVGNKNAAALSDLGYQVAVPAEYAQRNLQRNIANRLGGRQSRRDVIIGANNCRHRQALR